MGGILKSIQKKGPKAGSLAREALIRTSPAEKRSVSGKYSRQTQITTLPENLGDAERLLAELKAEAKNIIKQSEKAAGFDPSQTTYLTRPIDRTRIKMLNKEPERKRAMFDDSLPFWLTDPQPRSPHVDVLVPVAREALNDVMTEDMPKNQLPFAIRKAVNVAANKLANELRISTRDIEEAVDDLLGLMTGKGPLQALYDDPSVTDIYLDGHKSIKCVRRGQALETPFSFRSAEEFEAYVNNMLQTVDRVLNLSSPIVDCVLNDHWRSRINAIHASLLDGKESAVVVRVPRLQQVTFYDLLQTRTLPSPVAAWLTELVAMGEANILVVGPTGSGKTVMTTALLSAVGSDERICTIEDVPEIFVPTSHLEKLVARPENAQGNGAIGMDMLLRAALRRAPHRIVVGEIRDREGPLFLKALETGHAGSVATIHASTPKEAMWRLLDVVAAYEQSPQESLQRRISRSVNVLISMRKINGRPCLIDVAEVHSPVEGEFIVQQIVRFESELDGNRTWRLATNHSIWIDKLAARGVELNPGPNLHGVDPVEHKEQRNRDEE